jgi:hypothetical protein
MAIDLRPLVACALLLAGAWSARAAEPPAVKCPTPKPPRTPPELKATFSTDPKVTFEEQRQELDKLTYAQRDEECADALRWLGHQPAYSDDLRAEALRVLANWNLPYLFDDLLGMIEDPAQSEAWRARSVKLLGLLNSLYLEWDEKTCAALHKYGASPQRFLRDAALAAQAQLAYDISWRRNHPERLQALAVQLGQVLADAPPESLVNALRAIALSGAYEQAGDVERLAGDAEAPKQVRLAALDALEEVARPESLSVVEAAAKSGDAELKTKADEARPYALVARLGGAEPAAGEQAYNELSRMGAAAEAALVKAALGEESDRQRLARTLLGNALVAQYGLKIVERGGLKKFGEDAAQAKAGIPTVLWDQASKLIAVESEFVLEAGALEYVAVCKGENAKLHETVVAAHCSPTNICLALLACGYVFVGEVREEGKIKLPKGAGVMLSVEYERETETPRGKEKTLLRLPIEVFALNAETHRPMKRVPWAFTGSRWEKGEDGKPVLRAEIEKSVAAIMVDPDAILNTPLDSADVANVGESRVGFYNINRFIIPKRGTPCTLIFEPWVGEQLTAADVHDRTDAPAKDERK